MPWNVLLRRKMWRTLLKNCQITNLQAQMVLTMNSSRVVGPLLEMIFFSLVTDFYNGEVELERINTSFITLIAKTDTPINAGDFRPISLLNSVLKIITKLLANILQRIILKIVHKNQ
jgi:hypothetical protein